MTIRHFNGMKGIERLQALTETGVYIGQRTEGSIRISLYQLDSFYVEIQYHIHQRTFICMNSFSDTKCLDPYLSQIDISGLYAVS